MIERKKFLKQQRIHLASEIKKIRKEGEKIFVYPFVVYFAPNSFGFPRLVMSLTRFAGSSVVRSRCRRIIREYFRQHRSEFGSLDYLFFSSKPLKEMKVVDWNKIWKKIGQREN